MMHNTAASCVHALLWNCSVMLMIVIMAACCSRFQPAGPKSSPGWFMRTAKFNAVRIPRTFIPPLDVPQLHAAVRQSDSMKFSSVSEENQLREACLMTAADSWSCMTATDDIDSHMKSAHQADVVVGNSSHVE